MWYLGMSYGANQMVGLNEVEDWVKMVKAKIAFKTATFALTIQIRRSWTMERSMIIYLFFQPQKVHF